MGKLNEAPAANAPVGRLELDAVNNVPLMTRPFSLVILILATQVTFTVLDSPIGTEPKSTGLVHVNGKATGEPYACEYIRLGKI
jgi:hypothetical protein